MQRERTKVCPLLFQFSISMEVICEELLKGIHHLQFEVVFCSSTQENFVSEEILHWCQQILGNILTTRSLSTFLIQCMVHSVNEWRFLICSRLLSSHVLQYVDMYFPLSFHLVFAIRILNLLLKILKRLKEMRRPKISLWVEEKDFHILRGF